MTRLFTSAAAIAILSGAALAADLPVFEAPPIVETAPVSVGYDWSGFYFGGHGGYGWADFEGTFDVGELDSDPPAVDEVIFLDALDVDGFLGGAHAGWNYQSGNLVIGIEGDVSVTSMDDEVFEAGGANELAEVEIDFLASLRGRAGVAVDRVLFYGTAGVAYVTGEYTVTDEIGTPDELVGSEDLDQFGLVAGGGLEWAVWDNLSLRAEGLYYLFGEHQDTSGILGDPFVTDGDPGDFVQLNDVVVVRGGASFHF